MNQELIRQATVVADDKDRSAAVLRRQGDEIMARFYVGTADFIRKLQDEIICLNKVISEHELCHEDGEVTPECFAKSCVAYQQKKFGHSPTQDELSLTYSLLGQIYEQIGNHRPAEIRHVVTPGLRDEIRDYLNSKGYWDNP